MGAVLSAPTRRTTGGQGTSFGRASAPRPLPALTSRKLRVPLCFPSLKDSVRWTARLRALATTAAVALPIARVPTRRPLTKTTPTIRTRQGQQEQQGLPQGQGQGQQG